MLIQKRLNLRNSINALIIKLKALEVTRHDYYREYSLMSNIYNMKRKLYLHANGKYEDILDNQQYMNCCTALQDNLRIAYEHCFFSAIIHKNSIYMHYLDLILLENYPYTCHPWHIETVREYMLDVMHHCDGHVEMIDRELVVLEGHIDEGEAELERIEKLIVAQDKLAQDLQLTKLERSPTLMFSGMNSFTKQSRFKFLCGPEHPFSELQGTLHKVPTFAWG